MSLKTKVKSYSFWVSLASALILILKLVGQKFGFSVDEGLISDLFTSLCAILVIMGIIVVPNSSSLESKIDNAAKSRIEPLVDEAVSLEDNGTQNSKNVTSQNLEVLANDVIQIEPSLKVDKDENQEELLAKSGNVGSDETRVESDEVQAFDMETSQTIKVEQPEQKINLNTVSGENIAIDPFNMSAKLESFIDKVCSKRNELSTNIAAFAEFLQSELDSVKNRNN